MLRYLDRDLQYENAAEVRMTDLRGEYLQNGYVTYPKLLDSIQLKELLAEIDRIGGNSTLAVHDKSRLEMETDQEPEGRLVRRIYEPCSHYPVFRGLSDSPKLLDIVELLLGADLIYHYSKST